MTPEATVNAVRAALHAYLDPYLQDTLGAAQAVREVRAAGAGFTARIALGFPVGGYQAELTAARTSRTACAAPRVSCRYGSRYASSAARTAFTEASAVMSKTARIRPSRKSSEKITP